MRRKQSLDREKQKEVDEMRRKKKEAMEAGVSVSMPLLGENDVDVGQVKPDGEVEMGIAESKEKEGQVKNKTNLAEAPRSTITSRTAEHRSPAPLALESTNGNLQPRGAGGGRVFPELDAANNHAKRQREMATQKESSYVRRFATWLGSCQRYNALAPVLAVVYNAWSIPLRLVFIPEW